MFSIRPLPEFTAWLDGLKDETVRGVIVARIKRLQLGLTGDVQPVGDGVSELRIHFGAGWRMYFIQRGAQIYVLLLGGSKRTQKADIKRAKALSAMLEGMKEQDEQKVDKQANQGSRPARVRRGTIPQ